jgi:hypothetical protein
LKTPEELETGERTGTSPSHIVRIDRIPVLLDLVIETVRRTLMLPPLAETDRVDLPRSSSSLHSTELSSTVLETGGGPALLPVEVVFSTFLESVGVFVGAESKEERIVSTDKPTAVFNQAHPAVDLPFLVEDLEFFNGRNLCWHNPSDSRSELRLANELPNLAASVVLQLESESEGLPNYDHLVDGESPGLPDGIVDGPGLTVSQVALTRPSPTDSVVVVVLVEASNGTHFESFHLLSCMLPTHVESITDLA